MSPVSPRLNVPLNYKIECHISFSSTFASSGSTIYKYNCSMFASGLSRPLGTSEISYYTLDLDFRFVTFVLKAKVRGQKKITSEMIQQALKVWQEENAPLKVKVQKRGSEFWFVPLNRNIPYKEVYSNDWLHELHNLSQEKLPFGILCRVRRVITPGNNLVLLVQAHHVLVDGLSLCVVLTELADIMSNLKNGRESHSNKQNPSQLNPPWEHCAEEMNIYPSGTAWILSILRIVPKSLLNCLLVQVLKCLKLPENKDQSKVCEFFTAVPQKDDIFVTKIIPFCLKKKTTQNLVKSARQHEATIFGVLSAALRTVIEKHFAEKSGIPTNTLTTHPFDETITSVGLRRFFKERVSDNYLGMYVITVEQSIGLPDGESLREKFWKLARCYSEDLHGKMKNKVKQILSISMFKMESFSISKWPSSILNHFKSKELVSQFDPVLAEAVKRETSVCSKFLSSPRTQITWAGDSAANCGHFFSV